MFVENFGYLSYCLLVFSFLRVAKGKSVGRNRIARSGKDSIGRVAADWETGADDAGNSKSCGRSYEFDKRRQFLT